jgi:hypothetical protein
MMGEKKLGSIGSMCGQTGGIKGGRAVAWDSVKENHVVYASENGVNFAGVSDNDVLDTNNNLATAKQISITPWGDVECIAAGVINAGDRLYVTGTEGMLSSIPATPGTYNCVGAAVNFALALNDRFIARIVPATFPVVVS